MHALRNPFVPTALAALAAAALVSFPALGAQCSAQSGAHTAVLVELYTSEGCDSCPPADRWLSSLGAKGYAPDKVVPLALHVDYWDYIGWKDPYARREFTTRQRKQAELKRARIVYTPQVLLQGQDFRQWSSGEFADAVEKLNRQPPRAQIGLVLNKMGRQSVDVSLSATLLNPDDRKVAAVYLAAFENKLTSQVAAGENRGRTLPHDYVVREWVGPIEFGKDLKVADKRTLPLLPEAIPAHSGVAAFVQNRKTGEVLQALMLPGCAH